MRPFICQSKILRQHVTELALDAAEGMLGLAH